MSVAVGSNDGLGAASDARCWCQACRPITFADMRMVLCPTCGDKRCLHALSHEAGHDPLSRPVQVEVVTKCATTAGHREAH